MSSPRTAFVLLLLAEKHGRTYADILHLFNDAPFDTAAYEVLLEKMSLAHIQDWVLERKTLGEVSDNFGPITLIEWETMLDMTDFFAFIHDRS